MKRVYAITLLSALTVILAVWGIYGIIGEQDEKQIKVGFVCVGDASTAYTENFISAQKDVENQYGDQVEIFAKYNVREGKEEEALRSLVNEGCDLIFTSSYGYGENAKKYAGRYPDIQFCQATCANANDDPKLDNYHTFMGEIYQGRYAAGVVAGMKLKELIDEGTITAEQAKAGYVAAYPYAEVISGYTAFFLGIRSIVPKATMEVRYTNTWGSYALEKKCAEELIAEGCIIISQHSDTMGPAVACEETDDSQIVFHVGYNQSMMDVAPTTYLTGSRINWKPYILAAVQAVLSDREIETCVDANINGNDAGAGFEEGWVEMLELNEIVAAEGTKEKLDEIVEEFCQGKIDVFQGDYIGVDPYDPNDTYDLNQGYRENERSSAPTFHYILKDVISVK